MSNDEPRDELLDAFKAGFQQSAEGFNGEYTPSRADVDDWLESQFEDWYEGRE